MPAVEKRTVSLPADQARFVDELVAAGGYASVSEVVRAGLRALQERDAAVERWLLEEVAPVYDAMATNPDRAVNADHARQMLVGRHMARLGVGKRGGA